MFHSPPVCPPEYMRRISSEAAAVTVMPSLGKMLLPGEPPELPGGVFRANYHVILATLEFGILGSHLDSIRLVMKGAADDHFFMSSPQHGYYMQYSADTPGCVFTPIQVPEELGQDVGGPAFYAGVYFPRPYFIHGAGSAWAVGSYHTDNIQVIGFLPELRDVIAEAFPPSDQVFWRGDEFLQVTRRWWEPSPDVARKMKATYGRLSGDRGGP